MKPGSIVIVHLMNPSEKYWGVLESLDMPGLTLRGINLSGFDDWTRSIACETNPSMGLSTMFFPMQRVERMFLDEQVGEVESLCQRFERRVGKAVEEYLVLGGRPGQFGNGNGGPAG